MKKLRFLPAILAATALLTACKEDDPAKNEPSVAPPTEGVTTLFETFESLAVGDNVATAFTSWTEVKGSGAASWKVAGTSSGKYAEVSGEASSADVDVWLLTPALDLAAKVGGDRTLTFSSQLHSQREGSNLRLYVLKLASASDPDAVEIAAPKVHIAGAVEGDKVDEWIASGDVDLSSYSGIVYVGFRYTAKGGPDKSTTYRIDNVKFNVAANTEPTLIYSEDFGTTASGNPSVTAYTGYSKQGRGAASVAYATEGSGAVTVRTTSPSVNTTTGAYYEGASGSCNAMMAAAGASFVIKNIASCGARNIDLSFGSNHVSDTIALALSVDDAATWAPVQYAKTTADWGKTELTLQLPEGTTCFALKFTAAKNQYGARVDDIIINTTDAVGEPASCSGSGPVDPGPATEISITELRALNADATKTAAVTIPDGKKIVGVVVSDGANANTTDANLQLVAADNSAGIMVHFAANHTFALGDKVEVVVSGQSLEFYSKLLQVNGVPVANATKVGTGTVTPAAATIAQLTASFDTYESRLVAIDGVTFVDAGTAYSGTKDISDATGAMKLYTRTQATFAGTLVPTGAQNMMGFTTRFNDDLQLCIRTTADVVAANPSAPSLSITSPSAASVNVGEPFTHTFTTQEANLAGATVITCDNLPAWLTLSGTTLSGTAPADAGTFSLNITATNGATTATQTLVVTVNAPVAPGTNLVANGDFSEAWTSGIPTGWNSDVPDKITVTQGAGSIVVTNPTGTTKLWQQIPVTEGTTYKLSFTYKASHAKFRIWSGFAPTAGSTSGIVFIGTATDDDLRTKNGYFPVAASSTSQEYTFIVPAGQSLFHLEFRYYTQPSSSFELDDVTLLEVQ